MSVVAFTDTFERDGLLNFTNGWTPVGWVNADVLAGKHTLGTLTRRANPFYGETYTPSLPYLHAAGPDHAIFNATKYWGQPSGDSWGYPYGKDLTKATPFPIQGRRFPFTDGNYYTYVVDPGTAQKGALTNDIRVGLNPSNVSGCYSTWELNGSYYGHYTAILPYGGYVAMSLADLPAGGATNTATRVACFNPSGALLDLYAFPDQRQYFGDIQTFQSSGESAGGMRKLGVSPSGWWEGSVTFFADGLDRTFLGFADGEIILCANSTDPTAAPYAIYLDWDNGGYIGIWFNNSTGGRTLQGSVNGNSVEPNSIVFPGNSSAGSYPLTEFTYTFRIEVATGVCEVIVNGDYVGGCTIPADEWARYTTNPDANLGGFTASDFNNGEEFMAVVKYQGWVAPASTIAPGSRHAAFIAPIY